MCLKMGILKKYNGTSNREMMINYGFSGYPIFRKAVFGALKLRSWKHSMVVSMLIWGIAIVITRITHVFELGSKYPYF